MADYKMLGQTADGGRFGYSDSADALSGGSITFNTFSGTDMRVFFKEREVGTLMSITIGVTREKNPIYTCLGTNPRGFTRGKRSIAGTMVFGQFDRHALLQGPFSTDYETRILGSPAAPHAGINSANAMYGGRTKISADMFGRERRLQYADQLPPFDVVITFSNDAGAASVWKVVGVEVISEGYGFTMDDTSQDMACAYAAREVHPLTPVSDVSQYFQSNFLRHERPYPGGSK